MYFNKLKSRIKYLFILGLMLVTVVFISFKLLDYLFPLPLNKYYDLSVQVNSKEGIPLRNFLTTDDKLRLKSNYNDLPDLYWKMLIRYEDKRFYNHYGVDFFALLRALYLNISTNSVVSGGSTLTMQVAKLLEKRPRNIKSKIIEIFRSYQLENKFSKKEILGIYSTLTPIGKNKEGITTASWIFFNKPPNKLTTAEIAWLVALPQRPNRYLKNVEFAKNKILQFSYENKILTKNEYLDAKKEIIDVNKYKPAFLAPHYTRKLFLDNNKKQKDKLSTITTSINFELQKKLESVLKKNLINRLKKETISAIILDNKTKKPVAWVGSADFFSNTRLGQNDMNLSVRSPGSILKPFIYLMAFEKYKYLRTTTIDDNFTRFSNYTVKNYYSNFNGRLTLADALRLSLNTTAVKLLNKVGVENYVNRLGKLGLKFYFPKKIEYNLSLALGGFGVTGFDIVKLYAELANCSFNKQSDLSDFKSCWQIRKILELNNDNYGRIFYGSEPVSFKTGTSYSWRDKWAVGFTKKYSILVWIGRADGKFSQAKPASEIAVPILRQIVGYLPNPPINFSNIKPAKLKLKQIPKSIKSIDLSKLNSFKIIYPKNNDKIEKYSRNNKKSVIEVITEGGKSPFLLFVNDEFIEKNNSNKLSFIPKSAGFYRIQVIDSNGSTKEVNITKNIFTKKYKKPRITKID